MHVFLCCAIITHFVANLEKCRKYAFSGGYGQIVTILHRGWPSYCLFIYQLLILQKHLAFGSVWQWLIVINAHIAHVEGNRPTCLWKPCKKWRTNTFFRSLIWSSMLINTSLIIVRIGALWPLPLIGGIVASLLCSSNARQIYLANLLVNYLTDKCAVRELFKYLFFILFVKYLTGSLQIVSFCASLMYSCSSNACHISFCGLFCKTFDS